jgi:hypothetical protein
MLKNEVTSLDLVKISEELIPKISSAIKQTNATIIYDRPLEINYPVIQYPNSIDSLNLDKSPLISGMLLGIKAQYLIFDCGVLNIRKFSSYNIAINY